MSDFLDKLERRRESGMKEEQLAFQFMERAYNFAKANRALCEPELLKGYGRRNTTLTAISPTTSSAFILGQVSL